MSTDHEADGNALRDEVEVSVILPMFNPGAALHAQLDALDRQEVGVPWELLVVDNGSTDGSRHLAQRWAADRPHCRVLDAVEQPGAAHARNIGSQAARGRLLLFTDADDIVAPGWIDAMIAAAEQGALLGGVDTSLHVARDRSRSRWRLAHGTPRSDAGGNFVWSEATTSPAPPVAVQETAEGYAFLPFARGGNLGIRAEVLAEVGGWDESWIRGQDVELSWRVQVAGYPLYRVPGARVGYRRPERLWALAHQQYGFGRRAPLLYRAFEGAGAPQPRLRPVLRALVGKALRVVSLVLPARRRGWVMATAGVLGRAVGTVRRDSGHTIFLDDRHHVASRRPPDNASGPSTVVGDPTGPTDSTSPDGSNTVDPLFRSTHAE